MMKRIALALAIGVIASQALTGVALACAGGSAGRCLGDTNPTPPTTSSCAIVAGIAVVTAGADGSGDARIWTDGSKLYCDDGNGDSFTTAPSISSLQSAIVYASGDVTVTLEARNAAGNDVLNNRPADFGNLAITVDAVGGLVFDAAGLDGYYGGNVTLTNIGFSGQGLRGTIYGAASADYEGGGAADSFDGSAVTTVGLTATGGGGNDVLKGGARSDTLGAGPGSDKLFGNAEADTLNCDDSGAAGVGNDQCWGGAGDDVIDVGGASGTGMDVAGPGDGFDAVNAVGDYAVTYADATAAVKFSGLEPTVVVSGGVEDQIAAGMVAFTGSPLADTITGFAVVAGGNGSDTIVGTAGDDTITGGGGNDKIRTDGGDDTVSGGGGNDTIKAGDGEDRVAGGGGDDVLYGSGGTDFLKGGKGIDQAWGGAGVDTCSSEVRDSCEYRQG